MKKIIRISLLVGIIGVTGVSTTSCSLDPVQSNYKDNEKTPIRDVAELLASLNGSYARMASELYYGRDIIAFSESRSSYMYSDDRSGRFGSISGFTILPTHAYAKETWEQIYKVISNTNRVLEADVSVDAYVEYYKGQAYIIRALAHYDLVRLYGEQYVGGKGLEALGVPYKTSFSDIDEAIKRPTVRENEKAIFEDLNKGIELMIKSQNKVGSQASERARFNLASAYGLKSRIALFFSKYDNSKYEVVVESAMSAIKLAKERNINVISRSGFLDGYKGDGIMSNSLLELTQSGVDNRGVNSLYNIYFKSRTEGYGDLIWKDKDLNRFFPKLENNKIVDDIRGQVIGPDFQGILRNLGKYTVRTSNIRFMRIEEIMLNYIEATIKGASNGDNGVALDFLNEIVRQRVTLQDQKLPNQEQPAAVAKSYSVLDFDIYKMERVRELMFEGFDYEDIMRFEGEVVNPKVLSNPSISKGKIVFGDALTAFPIPQSEINVSKIEQNQAYK
ncbi:MAG: RagB/SusD family nutrient uptake outer membrane protein [Myroides sp.]|nr:RagB/SusD family nutrient uptake outer membrane protein [Myroides sp.]